MERKPSGAGNAAPRHGRAHEEGGAACIHTMKSDTGSLARIRSVKKKSTAATDGRCACAAAAGCIRLSGHALRLDCCHIQENCTDIENGGI
jgi:hypothetical protein